jgi:hypothetical protein
MRSHPGGRAAPMRRRLIVSFALLILIAITAGRDARAKTDCRPRSICCPTGAPARDIIMRGGPVTEALKAQLERERAEIGDRDYIPKINERPLVSTAVSGLQVFDVETWWDSANPRGLLPSIRFGIRNVGKSPIGNLAIKVYFYKPSGTPFGKSEGDLIPYKAPALPQGYWLKVDLNDQNFGSRRYESDEPEKLHAEIAASIYQCPELLLARIDFGERPHRLETHGGSNFHPISRAKGINKPFPTDIEFAPPEFYVGPDQIELVNIRASWAEDKIFRPNEMGPVLAFDVHNKGASAISQVHLIADFATPEGEVIGGCDQEISDLEDAPLRPGATKPATINCNPYSPANNPGPTPLTAQIYLKTDPSNAIWLRSIDIPAR